MDKPKFEFEREFETQRVTGFSIGRITLGKHAGVVRLVLMPDGIHMIVPASLKGLYIHEYEDTIENFAGVIR